MKEFAGEVAAVARPAAAQHFGKEERAEVVILTAAIVQGSASVDHEG